MVALPWRSGWRRNRTRDPQRSRSQWRDQPGQPASVLLHPAALVGLNRPIVDRHLASGMTLDQELVADVFGAAAGKQVVGRVAGDRHGRATRAEKVIADAHVHGRQPGADLLCLARTQDDRTEITG